MEPVDINQLKANPKNPRKINKHDYAALVESIKKFGDLSGIVFNRASGQLVGGHQRIEAFKRLGGQPQITSRFEQPNSVGTVALGYVLLGDERFGYREVEWALDATDEMARPYSSIEFAANIAANRIQGDFDTDLLSEINYELSKLENGDDLLALTGQHIDEINALLNDVSNDDAPADDDSRQRMNFKMTDEQSIIVDQAINEASSRHTMGRSDNDDLRANAIVHICNQYVNSLNDNPEISEHVDQQAPAPSES